MASKKIHDKYTFEELHELAQKYNQRSEFRKNHGGAYAVAGNRKILNEICSHMGKPKNFPYTIEELTIEASKYKSRSEFESKNKKMYAAVINRKLGNLVFKNLPVIKREPYSYEELAQLYSSCYSKVHLIHVHGHKTEVAAERKGFLESLLKLFNGGIPPGFKTIDDIKPVALNYKSFREFKSKEHLAYLAAQRLGFVNNIKDLFSKRFIKRQKKLFIKQQIQAASELQKKFTLEELINICSRYKTTKDFELNEPEPYNYAKREKILFKILKKAIKFPNSEYSISDIYNDAKKYKTLGDFAKSSRRIYHLAKVYGIFEDVCSHMKRLVRQKYTDQELIAFAQKHKYRDDLRLASSGVYTAIFNRKLTEVAFKHMPPKKFGKMEDELRKFVAKYYECKKYRDNQIDIEGKPFIKRLEIDILIPELNKGIEFDGTYWHSSAVLRERRPHWPETDILNYEKIKDEYFKSKGIEILHITEADWLSSRKKCKQRVLRFLRTN